MFRIPITNSDLPAYIDYCEWYWVQKHNWYICEDGYARTTIKHQSHLLHVLIARKHGLTGEIDHKDRDKRDCRIENLRSGTRTQNIMNSGPRKDNKFGLKGISWSKTQRKYRAKCGSKRLGSFDSLKEASDAYDKAAFELGGEFAYLNNYEGPSNVKT